MASGHTGERWFRLLQTYGSNASNFFLSKCNCNNNEILMDDSYISFNYKAILPQSLRHFQHTSANDEYDSTTLYANVLKFRATTSVQITKTLFRFPLQGQTRGSRPVPNLGCAQDGEEQSYPFFRLPHVRASWCEARHCREGEGRLSCSG
jgi:hypothetical protein